MTATGITLAGAGAAATSSSRAFTASSCPRQGRRLRSTETATRIASVRTDRGGNFFARGRVGTPDARYTVRYGGAVSNAVALAVRPGLDTAFSGSGQLGTPLSLLARERPATAGTAQREGLARAPARRGPLLPRPPAPAPAHRLGGRLPRPANAATGSRLPRRPAGARADRLRPSLGPGSQARASSSSTAGCTSSTTRSAASTATTARTTSTPSIAFQKLYDLPRTGARGRAVLASCTGREHPAGALPGRPRRGQQGPAGAVRRPRRQGRADRARSRPAPPATRRSALARVRKMPGFNAKAMYDSSFFVGAFAIHGYHTCPPCPASHGCVRIPLWVAPRLYSLSPTAPKSTSTGRAVALALVAARRGGWLVYTHVEPGDAHDPVAWRDLTAQLGPVEFTARYGRLPLARALRARCSRRHARPGAEASADRLRHGRGGRGRRSARAPAPATRCASSAWSAAAPHPRLRARADARARRTGRGRASRIRTG